jgi:WD40 repeat protein
LIASDRPYFPLVEAIDWSSDGALLAASTSDGVVRAWSIPEGHLVNELDLGRFVAVRAIRWAPAAAQLAIGTDAMTVMVWDPTSPAPRRYMRESWGVVYDVQWSPDSSKLAAATYSQTVRIWDPRTGATVFELPHLSMVTSLAWSPDGNRIAVSTQSHGISLWNSSTGQLLRYLVRSSDEPVSAISWSPNGTMLASLESNAGVVIWDTTQWTPTLVRPGPTGGTIDWRLDSSGLLVTLFNRATVFRSYCVLVPPIDTDPICPSASLQGIASIEWFPDGTALLVAPMWPAVQILDVDTLIDLAKIPHDTYIARAKLSPHGEYLAIALSNTIELWSLP